MDEVRRVNPCGVLFASGEMASERPAKVAARRGEGGGRSSTGFPPVAFRPSAASTVRLLDELPLEMLDVDVWPALNVELIGVVESWVCDPVCKTCPSSSSEDAFGSAANFGDVVGGSSSGKGLCFAATSVRILNNP